MGLEPSHGPLKNILCIEPYFVKYDLQTTQVVNVVAHHVPTVQVSPDHLQVVWCRQLVKVSLNH